MCTWRGVGEGFECVLSRSASGREKCYEAVLFLLAECVLPLALYSFEYISGNLRIGFCVYKCPQTDTSFSTVTIYALFHARTWRTRCKSFAYLWVTYYRHIYTWTPSGNRQAHISSARNTPDLYVCVSTSLGIASDQSSSEPITRLYTERDTLVYLDT